MIDELSEDVVPNESDTAKLELDAGHPKLVAAVLQEQQTKPGHLVLIQTLKSVEHVLRKNYPDPERITVPVSRGMVTRQDCRREVEPIPDYVAFPSPAIVKGKPMQLAPVKVPAVINWKGKVVTPARELPVYVAAGPDGAPWRDSNGEFVVIDPQTGGIRQRVRGYTARSKRSWWVTKWRLFVQWWKRNGYRLDLKILKKRG